MFNKMMSAVANTNSSTVKNLAKAPAPAPTIVNTNKTSKTNGTTDPEPSAMNAVGNLLFTGTKNAMEAVLPEENNLSNSDTGTILDNIENLDDLNKFNDQVKADQQRIAGNALHALGRQSADAAVKFVEDDIPVVLPPPTDWSQYLWIIPLIIIGWIIFV